MAAGQMRGVVNHLRRAAILQESRHLTDGQLLRGFVEMHEEAAFEALVRRHGPMVLGVCRRVLRNAHDAEDAFQATFLVLFRKAASLLGRDIIGNWLYGVAYHTSLKARAVAAKRRTKEAEARDMAASSADVDESWTDLRPLLDWELNRLPRRFKEAVILADLEGKTRKEAARLLGIPEGTFSGRLTTARRLLARRLARHGMSLAGGLVTAGVSESLASAGVPSRLVMSTVKSATALGSGKIAAAGLISANVVHLTEGMVRTMAMARIKVGALLLLLCTLSGGAVATSIPVLVAKPTADRADDGKHPPTQALEEKPAGAQIPKGAMRYVTANFIVAAPSEEIAKAIGDQAEVDRARLASLWFGHETPPWDRPCVIRVKPGLGKADGWCTFETVPTKSDYTPKQEIGVEGPQSEIVQNILAREIMHTLLAHDLGAGYPRWVGTGLGIMAQSAGERDQQRTALRNAIAGQKLLSLATLFETLGYPKDVETFYAQSFSVAEFLVERKDRATFLAFVERGMKRGWDHAAQRYYGFDNVSALKAAWRKSLGPL